jgi:AcrR family transcriptional regulator
MTRPLAHNDTVTAFLDAAERLLIEVGYANITTRRLAEEAGANHGLVHYYFGSMEQLFISVLERYTDRLIERQAAMYAADIPFIEKWRTAMGFLDEDRESVEPAGAPRTPGTGASAVAYDADRGVRPGPGRVRTGPDPLPGRGHCHASGHVQ